MGRFFFELIDAPGIEDGRNLIEKQAQNLATKEIDLSDIIVYCADINHQLYLDAFLNFDVKSFVKVATKSDISRGPDNWIHTSSFTMLGVEVLKNTIIELVQQKMGRHLFRALLEYMGMPTCVLITSEELIIVFFLKNLWKS